MSQIVLEIDGPIGIVTLNNAEKHNAFDELLIAELTAAFIALDANSAVRVIILSALGKSFSAGADLAWMKRMANYSPEENRRDATALGDMMRTLHGVSKPTIARVQGAAYGGGVGLVACCDIAIGTHKAAFSLSEVKLGLIPAVISPYVISAIGKRSAQRYFLTAERFDAAEAFRIGLLHELSANDDDMDEKINAMCDALLLGGPGAQREAKSLVQAVASRRIDHTVIADTVQRIAHTRASVEGREGLAAFLEKRKPGWIVES